VGASGPTPLRANTLAFSWCVHSALPSSHSESLIHPHSRVFAAKTAFAAFGGILFGYDTGTISGLQQMPNWLRTFGHPVPVSASFPDGYGISSSQRSLIVSILSAGTFFGPFNHPTILRHPLTLSI
jgi:Sugar (and other) transporter